MGWARKNEQIEKMVKILAPNLGLKYMSKRAYISEITELPFFLFILFFSLFWDWIPFYSFPQWYLVVL